MFLLQLLVFYFGNVLMLISCQSDTTPQLLIANSLTVMLMDTDTGKTTIIASNLQRAVAIAYSSDYIYWADDSQRSISRIKYPSSSNETAEAIITEDIQIPDGIAIDTKHGHIYWTDSGIDKVLRSDLDGSNRTTILDTLLTNPRAISLDTTNRWIYLSDWGLNQIERCKFDGSSRTSIVTNDIRWPNGLTLDLNEEKIYWTDNFYDHIKSANLDGSDVQLIIQNTTLLPSPYGIAVSSSYIYYSDRNNNGIYKLSKENGSTPVLLSTEDMSSFDLKIYNQNDDDQSQSYGSYAVSVVPGCDKVIFVLFVVMICVINLSLA